MESRATGFSSLAGSTEGQTPGIQPTTSPSAIETIRKRRRSPEPSASAAQLKSSAGETNSPHRDDTWNKQSHSFFSGGEHPLEAATSALLNVNSGPDSGHQSDLYAQFAKGQDKSVCWNGGTEPKSSSPIDDKSGLITSVQDYLPADAKHISITAGNQSNSTVVGLGVVRLAPPTMKLEADGIPVEGVIKTAGKIQIHDQHQLSPKEPTHHLMDMGLMHHASTAVLQEMHPMRPTFTGAYDPYSGAPYGRVDSYFSGLPGAQMQTQLGLPPGTPYPNILTTGQEVYYARPGESPYYPRTTALYPAETTEELIASLNRMNAQAQPTVSVYKPVQVDMPSPVDSGIGDIIVTPNKDNSGEGFSTYTELPVAMNSMPQSSRKEYSRTSSAGDRGIASNRDSPIRIPKLENALGFQYTLEAPISTSVRKEDDKMTYINKGQFYTVTMEYYHDPEKPLKSQTVKSVLMVVFREEKPLEEELKCWQFWHTRQHSIKQRILDVDTKNSSGIVGNVEEVAHNAVQFLWNPLEAPVKINVAVHCLSTDFSNQKGVKGFPLHLQVDTYDEGVDTKLPFHRGYCQIKVFCDKGANRKMLHEARRDEKRRLQDQSCAGGAGWTLTAETSRKKSDAEYHEPQDRSEFYHMSNFEKPPVLFVPPEDYERFPPLESWMERMADGASMAHDLVKPVGDLNGSELHSPPPKRSRYVPPDRVMIYVRKPDDPEIYTPLHVSPPSLDGLLKAVCEKYRLERENITGAYRQCLKGVTAKIDDEMVKHYCNEDTYLLQLSASEGGVSVTLTELDVGSRPS